MAKLIAMWSGPRNISTALMRAWEARPDTVVCDEPLYAHYLNETGIDHPGAGEVIAAGETNLGRVVKSLTVAPDSGCEIYYQKQMAHHLLPGMDVSWVDGLANALLIREPREMLTSLLRVLPNPDLEATGLPRQVELAEREAQRVGRVPAILDSRDLLEDPGGMLAALCARLDVPYLDAMLRWEPGPRATDGVWAKHWYGSVERSTGFGKYVPKQEDVPARHLGLLRDCERLYSQLAAQRLAPRTD